MHKKSSKAGGPTANSDEKESDDGKSENAKEDVKLAPKEKTNHGDSSNGVAKGPQKEGGNQNTTKENTNEGVSNNGVSEDKQNDGGNQNTTKGENDQGDSNNGVPKEGQQNEELTNQDGIPNDGKFN